MDSLISNENYCTIRHDRTGFNPVTGMIKMGGGIIVYLKKGITYELFETKSICTKDIELCVLKLSAYGNKKQMLIVVYRPPNGNVTDAMNALSSCVEKFKDKYNRTEYVIMGDMNIDYLNKKCSQVKLLKGLEKQFGLTQIIEHPTRVTLQKTSLIDLCLTNTLNISNHGTLTYFLSDHFPIYLVKKTKKQEKKSCRFSGRSYVNYSLEAYREMLYQIDRQNIMQEENPDILWDSVITSLTHIADLLCPVKEFHITNQRPVYFTKDLVEFIKERDTILRIAIKKKDKFLWKKGLELRKNP